MWRWRWWGNSSATVHPQKLSVPTLFLSRSWIHEYENWFLTCTSNANNRMRTSNVLLQTSCKPYDCRHPLGTVENHDKKSKKFFKSAYWDLTGLLFFPGFRPLVCWNALMRTWEGNHITLSWGFRAEISGEKSRKVSSLLPISHERSHGTPFARS